MEAAVNKGLVRLERQRVEMRGRGDFSQRVLKDDPNYELAQRFYLGAWADSHGLVADTLAGHVSFPEWVEGCIKTFAQDAETQVAFVSNESIEDKCRELDRAADAFIHLFSEKLRASSKGLGKANVEAAIAHLSRSVRQIAARSKQTIFHRALSETSKINDDGKSVQNLESKPADPIPQVGNAAVAQSSPELDRPRARGRPVKIPDHLKERALRISGGKERAKILYQTSYPTPQQVKNVPTILRHFKKKRRREAE